MTVPAEKQVSLLSTRIEPLLRRHPANPILTNKDWPYPINSVFNAGATSLADGTTLLLCRVEDRRGLSHLCAARSANGVDGWKIDTEPTLTARSAELSGRDLGHRRSAHHVRSRTAAICGYLYLVFARRTRRITGADQRFPQLRTIRRNHATGRQRFRATAAEDRRVLGSYSSPHDRAGFAYVDLVLSRFALLGKA